MCLSIKLRLCKFKSNWIYIGIFKMLKLLNVACSLVYPSLRFRLLLYEHSLISLNPHLWPTHWFTSILLSSNFFHSHNPKGVTTAHSLTTVVNDVEPPSPSWSCVALTLSSLPPPISVALEHFSPMSHHCYWKFSPRLLSHDSYCC